MAENQVATREQNIIGSLDKRIAGAMAISQSEGGMKFQTMAEVLEFSKLMSLSQQAVPKHCRSQPGICLGLCIQAIEWRMSPYAVASKSYIVSDQIGYESQLVHAVIEARAPIEGRLRHSFSGNGDTRKCKVWATAKGEKEPLEYESPEFKTIQPKNSPLWKTKPDLQLYYNTSRDWARVYFPDVVLGVYTDDELAGMTVEAAKPITNLNELAARLPAPASTSSMSPEFRAAADIEAGEGIDQPSQEQGIDEPHDDAELAQEALPPNHPYPGPDEGRPYSGPPSGETPEERADREREEAARGERPKKGGGKQGSLIDNPAQRYEWLRPEPRADQRDAVQM